MPNFETGVLTRFKSGVDLKNRVKNDPRRFGDDFENFRKFREHFIRQFIYWVLTNGQESTILILQTSKNFPQVSFFFNMNHIFRFSNR